MVFLVGAGPGDPGLITVRGRECLQKAEVVIHDFLLNRALLAYAPNAEIINVAQQPERHPRPLGQINALMIEKARQGKLVVRLKGGDPLVFGRGGEEALALVEAGIPFQIIPGVTSATAVPTYAGIPITQRGVASSLAVIAGHNLENAEALDWPRLAHGADTLLFLMGIESLPFIVSHLLAAGRAPETPIGIVEQGTHPGQRTVVGTLSDIVGKTAGIKPPATIIVGEVVALRDKLRWFDRPDLNPLFGLRLMLVHAGQTELIDEISQQVMARGAEVASFSAVTLGPAADSGPLQTVLAALVRRHSPGEIPWERVTFVDPRAVTYFFEALFAFGGDARALAGLYLGASKLAAAETLQSYGLKADWVNGVWQTESSNPYPKELLVRSTNWHAAREAKGARVETLVVCAAEPATAPETWRNWQTAASTSDKPHAVVFTDPLAVEALARLAARLSSGATLAQTLASMGVICAGCDTAEAATRLGLHVAVVAEDELTAESLAEALRPWRATRLEEI
jgi:uroporphyrinogen III methyltransferase / synthase